jgi:hypothetical protein
VSGQVRVQVRVGLVGWNEARVRRDRDSGS